MKSSILILFMIALQYKTVIEIESCASSGRCRVLFDDKSTDLLMWPYLGMKVLKGRS